MKRKEKNPMKKPWVIAVMAVMLSGITAAQNQLENPGFEDWEDVLIGDPDTIREPAEWSSLKTSDNEQLSDFAPVVCERSADSHSGKYSIKLTNVASLIVANGAATNGRVHPDLNTDLAYMFTDTLDSRWNTPFTSRPDSMTGWFKYTPQGEDSLQVKIILHWGYSKQPDENYATSWVGMAELFSSVNNGEVWNRFSVPFTYLNEGLPEYALVVLNSGDREDPKAGSTALFDDFEMIYNSPQTSIDKPVVPSGFIFAVDSRYLVIKGMRHEEYTNAVVRDLTGKLVWNGSVSSDRIDISSAGLKGGIYLVTLSGRSYVFSQKIVLP